MTNQADRFYQGIALEDPCMNRLDELAREVDEARETRPTRPVNPLSGKQSPRKLESHGLAQRSMNQGSYFGRSSSR